MTSLHRLITIILIWIVADGIMVYMLVISCMGVLALPGMLALALIIMGSTAYATAAVARADLSQPGFEGLSTWRGDRLDDAQQGFAIGNVGKSHAVIARLELELADCGQGLIAPSLWRRDFSVFQ
jgi:hypothetical protein